MPSACSAAASAARAARRTSGPAFGSSPRQAGASTRKAMLTAMVSICVSLPGLACLIGAHDSADQRMADDIGVREADHADALDAGQRIHGVLQAGALSDRQVDLRQIAGHRHAALFAEPRQEHL